MTIAEIKDLLIERGEPLLVQFTERIEDGINEPNMLMKAKLISITKYEEETFKLTFDLSEYVEFNKSIASHDWFDNNHNPTLTWFESKHYPKNNILEIYFDDGFDVDIFNIIDDSFQMLLTYRILVNGEEKYIWFDSEVDMFDFYNKNKNDMIGCKSFKVYNKNKIQLI